MTVEAKAAVHNLERAGDAVDDIVGGVVGRRGFGHLCGMATAVVFGAAIGIAQGLCEAEGRAREVVAERGAALGVDVGVLGVGRALEGTFHVGAQIFELLGAQGALENVEPAAPVGIGDLPSEQAITFKANGAAIAQFEGPAFSRAHVGVQPFGVLSHRFILPETHATRHT